MNIFAVEEEEPKNDGPIEEHYYRRGDIDFCFLLNRTHHNLRVFDYRVGNYQQKRDFFDRISRAEGLKKVYTVVEKQDSKSWRSVGFSREGAIPGYFRTADAYVMSRVYTDEGDPIQGGAPKLTGVNVPDIEGGVPEEKPRSLSIELVDDKARLQKAADQHGPSALYLPFRRHVFRPDIALRGKIGKRQYWVGAELDTSFGHAKVDLMTAPQKEQNLPTFAYSLRLLLEELKSQEMASVFALVPNDAPLTAQVYASLDFKVTARLTDHLMREGEYVGVQLWHRRIAAANNPRLPSFI
jgi:hypothetical protein